MQFFCVVQFSLRRSQAEWLRQGSSLLRLRAQYFSVLQLRKVIRIVMWQRESCELCFGISFFSMLVLMIFLLAFLLKSASNSSFLRLGVEILFWSCNLCSRCAYDSIALCISVSADHSGMAASRFLAAAAACEILFCFAAENRKSS